MVVSGVNSNSQTVQGLQSLVSEDLFLCLPARNVNHPRIVMASASSTPSPAKHGEVDTSKPYANVHEAILRFDHTGVLKNSPEKRAYESPVVGKLKEQLAEAVAAKERVESDKFTIERELAELKVSYEEVSRKMALSGPLAADGEGGHADDTELQAMYEELLSARNRVEELEASIAANDVATQAAVKITEQAEATASTALKTFEDMASEMVIVAERDQAKIQESHSQVESLGKELSDVKQHEQELTTEVSTLKEKISELTAELNKVTKELATLKESEARALEKLGETSTKLREVEAQLKEVEDEKITLQATTRYLEPELESTKAELEALKIENTAACDQDVVEKYKNKVKAVKASQVVKGDDAVSGVLEGLEQVMAEAIEALVVKESVDGVNKSMFEQIRELKKVTETAEKKTDESLKEVDAVKLVEANAMESIKSLTSGDVEDEHLAKIHEVENFTSRKISEAEEEVKNIKEHEKELKKSLEAARLQIESSKLELKEANEKAAKSEAAKSAVEGELRRWRSENEQRRKHAQARAAASAAAHNGTLGNSDTNTNTSTNSMVMTSGTLKASQQLADSDELSRRQESEGRRLSHHGESLAEVLQMKLPGKEGHDLDPQVAVLNKKNKLKLLARLGAVFSAKKRR